MAALWRASFFWYLPNECDYGACPGKVSPIFYITWGAVNLFVAASFDSRPWWNLDPQRDVSGFGARSRSRLRIMLLFTDFPHVVTCWPSGAGSAYLGQF